MSKKIILSFAVFSFVLFWSSFASANFIDDLWDLWSVVIDIWLFLWALIKFIVFWFKTCFNLIYKAFVYIFSPELYWYIGDTFQQLVVYMWLPMASALFSLFIISFLLIIITFIFKLIKGQVSYNSALKKYKHQK